MTDEEKIIDQIIEILSLMNGYTPTQFNPANPLLPLIRTKITRLQSIRAASKNRFKLNFINSADVVKQLTEIKF